MLPIELVLSDSAWYVILAVLIVVFLCGLWVIWMDTDNPSPTIPTPPKPKAKQKLPPENDYRIAA